MCTRTWFQPPSWPYFVLTKRTIQVIVRLGTSCCRHRWPQANYMFITENMSAFLHVQMGQDKSGQFGKSDGYRGHPFPTSHKSASESRAPASACHGSHLTIKRGLHSITFCLYRTRIEEYTFIRQTGMNHRAVAVPRLFLSKPFTWYRAQTRLANQPCKPIVELLADR